MVARKGWRKEERNRREGKGGVMEAMKRGKVERREPRLKVRGRYVYRWKSK